MSNWRCGKGSLASKCAFFWDENVESLSDVTFIVGPEEEEIKGFKFPLILTSPVFESLFSVTWSSSKGQDEPVTLPYTNPAVFRLFLRLLLTDNVTTECLVNLNLSMKQVLELFFMSKEYIAEDLQDTFEIFIRKNMRVDTVLEIFEHVQGKDEEKLELDAWNFIMMNTRQVVEQKNLLTVSKKVLLTILSKSIDVDEVSLFKAASSWAESQASRDELTSSSSFLDSDQLDGHNKKWLMQQILRELLSEIRLPLLTIQDFAKYVRPTGVLDPEETIGLYYYMADTDEDQKSSFGPTLRLSDTLTVRTDTRSEDAAEVNSLFLSDVVSNPVFTCTGEKHCIWFKASKKVRIRGFGFCGPLHGDSEYEVKVWMDSGLLKKALVVEKKIFAQQRCIFYVSVPTPILINDGQLYELCFSLKGAPTGSTSITKGDEKVEVTQDDITFIFHHESRQLVVVKYSPT